MFSGHKKTSELESMMQYARKRHYEECARIAEGCLIAVCPDSEKQAAISSNAVLINAIAAIRKKVELL